LLAPLDGIGALEPPIVRIYNLVLLIVTIFALASMCKKMGWGGDWAYIALCIPVVWVLAGLALTEMLAVTCCTLAIQSLLASRVAWAVAGGSGFGIAVLCRPQLAVLAPGYILIAMGGSLTLARLGLFAIGGALVCFPVFGYWGGLTSPSVSKENYSNSTLSAINLVLASGYAGGMIILMAPGWFRLSKRELSVAVILGFIAFFASLRVGLEFKPFASLADRFLRYPVTEYYPRATAGLLSALAVVFWIASAVRVRELRSSGALALGSGVAMMAVVFSCAKITHQFSSRYVAVAFPFMILATAPVRSSGPWTIFRLVLGSVLGFLMLRSYLK